MNGFYDSSAKPFAYHDIGAGYMLQQQLRCVLRMGQDTDRHPARAAAGSRLA
jgi:hypothetical protein